MDLRQLRTFIGIFEAGSLLRAAAQLHIAQSALSRQLAMLEADLGCKLFIRGPQGVVPTEAGRSFYKHAQAIFRQIEAAQADLRSVAGAPSGSVSIGFPVAISPILAFPLFQRIRERYPGINLQITEGLSAYVREMLQNGRLDIAVLFLSSAERALRVTPLGAEEIFFVSADADAPGSITIEEIMARPLVVQRSGNGIRGILDAEFARRGLQLRPVAEIDCIATVGRIVAAGLAAAIMPASALIAAFRAPEFHIAGIDPARPHRPVALCTSEVMTPSVASQAVAELFLEVVRDLAGAGGWKGFSLDPSLAARRQPSLSGNPGSSF